MKLKRSGCLVMPCTSTARVSYRCTNTVDDAFLFLSDDQSSLGSVAVQLGDGNKVLKVISFRCRIL